MVCFLGWWFRFHRKSQVGVEGFMQHVCCVIGFPHPFPGVFCWFPKFFSYDFLTTVNVRL